MEMNEAQGDLNLEQDIIVGGEEDPGGVPKPLRAVGDDEPPLEAYEAQEEEPSEKPAPAKAKPSDKPAADAADLRERLKRAEAAAGGYRERYRTSTRELTEIKEQIAALGERLDRRDAGEAPGEEEELDPGQVLLDIRNRLSAQEEAAKEAEAQEAQTQERQQALLAARRADADAYLPVVAETFGVDESQAGAVLAEAFRYALAVRHQELQTAFPGHSSEEVGALVKRELDLKVDEWVEAGRNPYAEILDYATYHSYTPGIFDPAPNGANGKPKAATAPAGGGSRSPVRQKIAREEAEMEEDRSLGGGLTGRSGRSGTGAGALRDILDMPMSDYKRLTEEKGGLTGVLQGLKGGSLLVGQ